MKICISELTYNSFQELLDESLSLDDILLVNREGKLSRGEGHPEVVFVSYEIMFKILRDPAYKDCLLYTSDAADE